MRQLRRRSPAVARAAAAPSEGLPFSVEVWDLGKTRVERIIGRADTLFVARAIFTSAVSENPARRVVLRQGARLIESAG